MSIEKPDFCNSPFFVAEPGNWHLKPGAPEEMKKNFEKMMKNDKIKFSAIKLFQKKIQKKKSSL